MLKRASFVRALTWVLAACLLLGAQGAQAAAAPPAPPPASATLYYPLAIGNHWAYDYNRVTSFSLTPVTGTDKSFSTTTQGLQTVEIVRQDDERSGPNGKVFVQKTTEAGHAVGEGAAAPAAPDVPRLIGESYFRINDRGIWLITDGEPDDKGEAVAKITDRSLPLLWIPSDMKPDKSWVITCQIDTSVTARITSTVGKAQTLKVNGATYDNCLPVVSIADHVTGRLDLGIGKAPIIDGSLVDLTWYAPQIGVVKSHQVANFTLEPPTPNFTGAHAHFEESEAIQPGFKAAG